MFPRLKKLVYNALDKQTGIQKTFESEPLEQKEEEGESESEKVE